MIKFILDKIHLRNVRNYGDDGIEMDFPVGNLTVFTGHVGAGKSTILKSVSMALYGDDGGVKGEKLSIDDMVNERNGKNLEIELYFHSIDTLTNSEDKYEIHLYHKHKKYQNKLVFIKNGIDISANGKMDTYRLIEKTIIPKDVYHNIYYFTQQAKNFFTALPNSEQKAIFDSILDLSDYDKYYENCRAQISTYEKLVSDCELQMKMIQSGIAEKQLMIEREKENIKSAIDQNQIDINNLTNELEKAKKELNDLKSDLILEKSVSELDKDIVSLESNLKIEINNIDNKINQIKTNISDINEKIKAEFESEKVKTKEELQPKIDVIKQNIHDKQVELTKLEAQKENEQSKQQALYKEEIQKLESQNQAKLNDLEITYQNINNEIIQKKSQTEQEISEIKAKALETKSKLEAEVNKYESEKQNALSNELRNREQEAQLRDLIFKNSVQLNSETPHCDKCGQPLVNVDHLKKENENAEKTANELKEAAEQCKKSQVEYQIKIDNIKNEISLLTDNFKKEANEKVSVYQNLKSELEVKAQSIKSEKDLLTRSIEEKKSSIKQTFNMNLQNVISQIDSKISNINGEIEKLNLDQESEIGKAKQKLLEYSNTLKEKANQETKTLNDSILKLEQEKKDKYDEISSKVSSLKSKKLDAELNQSRVDQYDTRIKELEIQIKSKTEFKPSQDTLDSLYKFIAQGEEQLSTHKKLYDENSKTLAILEFWKTAFSDSGIKSMLIDVAIPHMNQCVREELDRVCPGTFTVSFDTLSATKSGTIRDKFAINITHNIKCATGHKKLSGGEKRIIDFCCMAALRSLAEKLYGKMFCHIFYDEVLDSLDSESRELFCRSMKNQSSDQRHVLLATHALTEDVDPDRVFPF